MKCPPALVSELHRGVTRQPESCGSDPAHSLQDGVRVHAGLDQVFSGAVNELVQVGAASVRLTRPDGWEQHVIGDVLPGSIVPRWTQQGRDQSSSHLRQQEASHGLARVQAHLQTGPLGEEAELHLDRPGISYELGLLQFELVALDKEFCPGEVPTVPWHCVGDGPGDDGLTVSLDGVEHLHRHACVYGVEDDGRCGEIPKHQVVVAAPPT